MTPGAMPHLSWNEARAHAIRFAREHADTRSESALGGNSLFRTEEYKSQDRVSITGDRKQPITLA